MKANLGAKAFSLILSLSLYYLFVLQIKAIWPFTIDDMYIPLRYAKHWAEGIGLLWNMGETPVEGYSNFSFVVLGRLALSLGYDPVTLLKAMGVLGLLGTCFSIYAITRMWFSKIISFIPCIWLLAYKGQIIWSVSGLETTVYQALLSASVFFVFRGLGYSFANRHVEHSETSLEPLEAFRYAQNDELTARPLSFFLAGFLLTLASMTRPEAPVFIFLFLCLLFFMHPYVSSQLYWRGMLFFCSTIFICFVPYFFWRLYYYSRLFPNPIYCKGLSQATPFILDKNYLRLIWPFILLAIPAIGSSKDKRHYFLWLPSVVYLILLVSADPVVAFANRLFLPAFVLLLPLSLQGQSILLIKYFGNTRHFNLLMYLTAFIIMLFFVPMTSLIDYRHFTLNPIAGEQLRNKVVSWLQHYASTNSRVVLADSGLIPYKSSQVFIDSYCLNNKEMAKQSAATMYEYFCERIMREKPEVIILTALIEKGKTLYTPSDACLAAKLHSGDNYCLQQNFTAKNTDSVYRYEIFSKRNKSCSTIH